MQTTVIQDSCFSHKNKIDPPPSEFNDSENKAFNIKIKNLQFTQH